MRFIISFSNLYERQRNSESFIRVVHKSDVQQHPAARYSFPFFFIFFTLCFTSRLIYLHLSPRSRIPVPCQKTLVRISAPAIPIPITRLLIRVLPRPVRLWRKTWILSLETLYDKTAVGLRFSSTYWMNDDNRSGRRLRRSGTRNRGPRTLVTRRRQNSDFA